MKKTLFGFIVLLVVAAASLQVFAQDNDPVILSVAGEDITKSEFMSVFMKNNLNNEVLDRKSLEDYMELYINFRLKVKEAEALGLDTVRAFREELAGYRKQLAQPYLIDEDMNKAMLQEAFERKQIDLRASHILIRVDKNASPNDSLAAYKKAMALRKRLLKGEDFGEVAMASSDDLSARDRMIEGRNIKGNRGDLGYFTVFDMVYPFENGAYNTAVGEISMPVRSDFGYHIIKVTDRKPALGRVQVAHIMMRLPADATAADSAEMEKRVFDVYSRLLNGEDFGRMADQYSDDKSTASKGGVLPWFGSNKMIPEFISEITLMKNLNDITKPFLTSFGWHIVKLLERKEIGSYQDNLNDMKQSLARNDRAKKSEEALLNRIKNEYKFTENLKARDAFYKVVTDSIFSGKWSVKEAQGLNKNLFTIGRRGFSQQDFALWLAKNQRKRSKEDIKAYVNGMYVSFVNETLLNYEDSQLESKFPEFKLLVREYHDGMLLFELTDQKIWSKAVKDSVGLDGYYKKNKNNYMWEQRVDATIYTYGSTDDKQIAALKKAIQKGLTSSEILGQFNTDSTTLLTIDRRKYQKGDNEMIDNIAWKQGLAPEIIDSGKVFLVNVNSIVAPEPKQLEEARGLITADYQNYLEKEWIKELRAKYPFKVNQQVLSSVK